MKNNETTPINQVRPILMKLFKASPGEKPLTAAEFDEVRGLVNIRTGGLQREAYHQFKDDKELMQAATEHRQGKNPTPENIQGLREPLLKFLNARNGEKTITKEEFKQVIPLIDHQRGGLTRKAYEVFREDKDVTQAASEHRSCKREANQGMGNGQTHEPNPDLNEARRIANEKLDQIINRRSASVAPATARGPEMGE